MADLEIDLSFQVDPEVAPGGEWACADPLIAGEGAEATWIACLRCWLEALAPELPGALRAPSYSLGLSLVDDFSIAALNSTWRQKEGPTDVLAFAAQDGSPPLPPGQGQASFCECVELGDIVISLETAARQAQEAGHGLDQEVLFLASHGLLHLLGWDHPDEPSLEAMLNRQSDLLSHTTHLLQGAAGHCGGESPR
ncbi:MAG: rRNA maturation RNase YbeY [Cyanobacteriota bacterium]|jgi:probable rRNA maturation factor|nr:rRNA maturation RNase YbeY [Cyanobacteriota bacterium]